MLPTQYDDCTQQPSTSNDSTPRQSINTIDDLATSMTMFVDQFKRLQHDHQALQLAFEAQSNELRRSRAEYQRKVEEWRVFKDSLAKRQGYTDKAIMTDDKDMEVSESDLTQDTASLLNDLQNSPNTQSPPLESSAHKKARHESTPPGFWEVNFTPAHQAALD